MHKIALVELCAYAEACGCEHVCIEADAEQFCIGIF